MTEHNLPDKDDAPWLDCMDGFQAKGLTRCNRRDRNSMTKPLSPAAQAVRDAAFSAYWSAEQEAPNDAHAIAAATLRAAARTLAYEAYVKVWLGLVVDADDLYAIAAELEEVQ